jgi:hypothetical protein
MLRLAVLLLLLANAAYAAWSQGFLAAWGIASPQQSEPQRLEQQIKPQVLRILGPDEVRRLETAALGSASKAPECLQAGPILDSQIIGLRQVLEPWPAGSWSLEPVVEPARWIIYMGKYQTAGSVDRKKTELREIGVSFEPLSNPALEPGLSLGAFTSQAAANQQLATLSRLGVRTAKVLQERPETRGQLLKLPAVGDGLRPRLDELKLALNGKTLRSCR